MKWKFIVVRSIDYNIYDYGNRVKKFRCFENSKIENYLLVPKAIFRLTKLKEEKYQEFLERLENLVENEKNNILDQISQHIKEVDAGLAIATCNQRAREILEEKWNSLEEKLSLVPGKKIIRKLNDCMRKEYGVSCSMDRIIKEIKVDEVANEMVEVLQLLS